MSIQAQQSAIDPPIATLKARPVAYDNQLLSAWPDRGAKDGAMPGLSVRANEEVFGMPELRLDDGWTLSLPDDASPQEIAEIVARTTA